MQFPTHDGPVYPVKQVTHVDADEHNVHCGLVHAILVHVEP